MLQGWRRLEKVPVMTWGKCCSWCCPWPPRSSKKSSNPMALTMKERVSTTPVSNNCFTVRLGKTFRLHLNTCTYVTHEEHLYFKAVSIVLFRTVKSFCFTSRGLKICQIGKDVWNPGPRNSSHVGQTEVASLATAVHAAYRRGHSCFIDIAFLGHSWLRLSTALDFHAAVHNSRYSEECWES